jgi:membrane-bound lytic murein transglycosylase A
MTDGTQMLIGYAGNNGHEYTSIGKLLVADGKLSRNTLSLPAIRRYFQGHPEELDIYTRRNERFVFFKQYAENTWPAGSLGVEVTALRSLATDKSVFPRGLPTLVVTRIPTGTSGSQSFDQFMADQDTGGAIRAPGRADIYMGAGPEAEHIAGQQLYEGRLYYLILKPQYVSRWLPTPPQEGPGSAGPGPKAGRNPGKANAAPDQAGGTTSPEPVD